VGDPAPLSAAESAHLVEFARACKAAARAVSLYPETHPAIAATVDRIVELTSPANLHAPLRIAVVNRTLVLDGRPLGKVDAAAGELAALLHDHVIGEMVVRPGANAAEWRGFLRTLGRPPEDVRAAGGIARVLSDGNAGHIDIREIDYSLVLQERAGLTPTDWDEVIASCLQDDGVVEKRLVGKLLDAAEAGNLGEVLSAIDQRGGETNRSASARALSILRLLHSMLEAAESETPERVEAIMRAMSAAIGELSPDAILALVKVASRQRASRSAGPAGTGPGTNPVADTSAALAALAEAMVGGMSNETIAHFVARHVGEPDSSTARLAQAFQALVQDGERRERLLTLAHDEAQVSPLGQSDQFEQLWEGIAQKLTAYSDRPFVSDDYARELTRAQTIPVEQVHDDSPERIQAWLVTVATGQLRGLDLVVVADVLRLEQDPDKWALLTPAILSLLEDFFLVGDLDAVEQLLNALRDDGGNGATLRPEAAVVVASLTSGKMMRHVLSLLANGDDVAAGRVQSMCLLFGHGAIRPLVEALAREERMRARDRLITVLRAFGTDARPALGALKGSSDAAVRRTVLHVLRELGESESLPDAAVLGNEGDSQAQRDAVRAVLAIGTDRAFRLMEQVLTNGTPASRDAVMHAIAAQRDERAGALYAFLVRHMDHRGPLAAVYQRAIQALGTSKSADAVLALESALYRRGDWWAPRRIAAIRMAAAATLARIATTDAIAVLSKAADAGPRGVRAVVQPHLRSRGGLR